MGSATSPSKKPAAKKAGPGRPSKPKPKPKPSKAKAKAGAKSKAKAQKIEPTLSATAVTAARHLRIPTNLPVCIVDNGGWTVKYGIVPPLLIVPDTVKSEDVEKTGNAEGGNASTDQQGNGESNNEINNKKPIHEESDNIQMASMYNATARPPHQLTVLAGDEITTRMKNLGQLTWNSPLERGMICDGETQLRVWARVLEVLGVVLMPMMGGRMGEGSGGFLATIAAARRGKPSAAAAAAKADIAAGKRQQQQATYSSNNCAFLLLEPPSVPSAISEGVDCILFRELGMARVARMMGPCMAAFKYLSVGKLVSDSAGKTNAATSEEWINDDTKCCCVVDSGYSFTHIVPTHRGEALANAIRRLNVGGKVLTNLLKEAVTYRQWNMMDEYHIVNDAKEQLCFVSDQFDKEMKKARAIRKGFRWFDREYLLPDFVNTFQGSVRLPEPLQRKKEMEEMEAIKMKMDRLNDEKERHELAKEANDLVNMQSEVTDAKKDRADNSSRDKRSKKAGKSGNSKKGNRRRKHKNEKLDDAANDDINEDADMDDSDHDSDEENEQQRLGRLKTSREAERKRREQESLERQALAMSVERFAIPEVLFRPSDIGLDCGGIAEAIVESIDACNPIFRAAMYHNVLLVGGNAKIPGYRERVELELRKLAPTNYEVRAYLPEDPASYAWEGAKQFARQPGFQEHFSVDRPSWEAMKKAGKNQQDIWSRRMHNPPVDKSNLP